MRGTSARSSKLVAVRARVLCLSPKSTAFLLIMFYQIVVNTSAVSSMRLGSILILTSGSPNRVATVMDPKLVIFRASVSGIFFGAAPTPKRRSSFGKKRIRKCRPDLHHDGFPCVVGVNKRGIKPKTVVQQQHSSSTRHKKTHREQHAP